MKTTHTFRRDGVGECGKEKQSDKVVDVSVGRKNNALPHLLLPRQERIHVRAECLGHFLPLVNQQIPPALRKAPLGFHCHQHFDKGLKVHFRGPGNCHGPLLDRRGKGVDVDVCYRGGHCVDETLAGVGNKPERVGNTTGQHRLNKATTSQNKQSCYP